MSEIITTSSGRTIEVFDDLFPLLDRMTFYHVVKNSLFLSSGTDYEQAGRIGKQLYSNYTKEHLERFGILNSEHLQKKVLSKYRINNIRKVRVNLSNCYEFNTPHADTSKYTLLYYCNVEWKMEWSGQTLFLNDSLDRVEYCSLFVPGRLIIFEGMIPHVIVTPSVFAGDHRYSFVIQFD